MRKGWFRVKTGSEEIFAKVHFVVPRPHCRRQNIDPVNADRANAPQMDELDSDYPLATTVSLGKP